MARLDLAIVGGSVVDGTGAPARPGDVGVAGGRIAAVAPAGALSTGAGEVVDAAGRVVCPGFIDIMSHSLWPLMIDGRSVSKLAQGVTTEVMGEGYTPAPSGGLVGPPDPWVAGVSAEWLARVAEWRRFGDWLDALADTGVSPNVASFLGGGTVREYACGMRAGPATSDELAAMRRVVDEAMADGALGVAYALIYPPDAYAGTDEIVEVATAAARSGGMYVSHIRSEGDRLHAALDEALEIGRRSGAPVEIYHLKASGGPRNWGLMDGAVERIEAARAQGQAVTADMYPYAASGTGLSARIPVSLAAGGRLFDRLAEPGVREWVRGELDRGTPEVDDAGPPEDTFPIGLRLPEHQEYVGRNLVEIADSRRQDWLDCLIDLLLAERQDVFTVYHEISEDNVRRQLGLEWIAVCSDGCGLDPAWAEPQGPVHPRDYGTFARVLGHYVRDERVLGLEDAVRKMTSTVAERLGIRDRGRVAEGAWADLVVFDPGRVRDTATYAEPHRLAEGVRDVWVNGVGTVRDGVHTGALAGRVLR
ncbi:MAG TPA: D-aminoacylase [Gaiellales bacterium]|jgi:N-acyl-D-aspartate/D-glutamate deacylase|nr:D-aminoacylase [Gaiellales bacterium]